MNLKDGIEIILGLLAIVAWIYQLASFERRIYERIAALETKLDVHLTDYANRRESFDYKLGGLNEKIDHKFNRLYAEVKDIARWLEKQFPFRVRSSGDGE